MRWLTRVPADSFRLFASGNAPGKAGWLDDTAVTAIEYALMASLVAMIALAGITVLGSAVQALWNGIANAVSGFF